ncbi:MAG: hypothetical protein GXO96_06360 [Nitrospirae bacterium]|nr:hypothetical protein [Candidatus Manganitrophaceae bacterium]
MYKYVLKIVGCSYGVLGVLNLSIFLYWVIFGPPIESFSPKFIVVVFGAPLLLASVSFMIAYSFWKLKKWGRYLAISANGIWILVVILTFVIGDESGQGLLEITIPVFLFSLVFLALPIAIIVLCIIPQVRILMN